MSVVIRCDQCGREGEELTVPRWYTLNEIAESVVDDHFCSSSCLAEWATAQLPDKVRP